MRDYKFRAWSKSLKRFLSTGFSILGEVTVFDMLNQHRIGVKDLDDLIISQATGLKDSEGKEIYEGDICKASKANAYLDGEYPVAWDSKKGRWAYKGNKYQVGSSGNLKCKIVGNIFEKQ